MESIASKIAHISLDCMEEVLTIISNDSMSSEEKLAAIKESVIKNSDRFEPLIKGLLGGCI